MAPRAFAPRRNPRHDSAGRYREVEQQAIPDQEYFSDLEAKLDAPDTPADERELLRQMLGE